MHKLPHYILFSVFFSLLSCNSQGETETETETDSDSPESIIEADTSWKLIQDHTLFTLKMPPLMEEMELNPEASVEYGWVEKVDDVLREMYTVVLVETKAEIDSFNLDFEFDAMSYRDISIESLGSSLEEYKILTDDPAVEVINGLDCVITETRGAMQVQGVNGKTDYIGVYYILAVFEGENAFYQVLTWCIEDQKYIFKEDMNRIIRSFQENDEPLI